MDKEKEITTNNGEITEEQKALMEKKASIMLEIVEKGKKNEFLTYNEIH